MMADLKLVGSLNLAGRLTLDPSGGKVTAGGIEVLVQVNVPGASNQGTAPPVILPPPPAVPLDELPNVWIVNSFNQTVTIGAKPIVALGMVMQGGKVGNMPTWPGMVLQSTVNSGPVKVNQVPVNVLGDKAVIFPTGASASLDISSGQ
jgi:hypothetical protein